MKEFLMRRFTTYMLNGNTILLYIHSSNNASFLMNGKETPQRTYPRRAFADFGNLKLLESVFTLVLSRKHF